MPNYILIENSKFTLLFAKYRKCPCISRTFFHKVEAKTQGWAYLQIHVFAVLKNLITVHKTS